MNNQFLYMQRVQVKHGHTHSVSTCKRIIPMSTVQWIEYDQQKNLLRIKYINHNVEEYPVNDGDDPVVPKKIFYNFVKHIQSNNHVIEW